MPSAGCGLPVEVRCVAEVSGVYATKIFILRSRYNHFANEDADCMFFWNVDKVSQFYRVPTPQNMINLNWVPPWNIKTNYVHNVCHKQVVMNESRRWRQCKTYRYSFLLLDFVHRVTDVRTLLFESRGCSLIFLQHFPIASREPVLFSGDYLHLWVL
jgi:hypothetical protein